MIRKTTRRALKKIRNKALSEVNNGLADIRDQLRALESSETENNRLIRELIVEQREREDKNLYGGVFQISEREVATKIFNGLIMYLDPRDIAVVPHIILEGTWERQITKAWQTVLDSQNNMTVLDIGANFGYFGMLAAQRLDRKQSKVILFEANPNLIPYINKNLSVNWLNENSVVENLAISDSNGMAKLNVLEDYTGSSSMHSVDDLEAYLSHKMHIKAESVIDVKTVTVDDYCKKQKIAKVDLIKMDIEGYEEKAYAGMRKIVDASPDMVLFIEFTKDGYAQPERFYQDMLKDFGNVYTIDPNGNLQLPAKTAYRELVDVVDDWIMLVFSKHKQPHARQQS